MCGLVAVVGREDGRQVADRAVGTLVHRGPDGRGSWSSADGRCALAHTRLSILDLSDAGRQPMASHDGSIVLAYNGEIYNHVELRKELGDGFTSTGDTEVLLAAWQRWGPACLDRLLGMFAFCLWDEQRQQLVAVRDRFGVKPLYVAALPTQGLMFASEIRALHAGGVPRTPDLTSWATYLATGATDFDDRTFWQGIRPIPPGHFATWSAAGGLDQQRWYDIVAETGPDLDERPDDTVADEYLALLADAVALRFRSDVPVGINLSGGLDSSTLLAAVHAVQGRSSSTSAFTFITGHDDYDELPWVTEMVDATNHPLITARLDAHEVPALAADVQRYQDEPFGGLPTLAYARLFEQAREHGAVVLLDGQGMDEQWAGYDYYRRVDDGEPASVVQGTTDSPVRPGCLHPDAGQLVVELSTIAGFDDPLRDTQVRDLCRTKLPRALRYNDRASMRASCELREPFLDHRLVELALRQPARRKVSAAVGKVFLRQLVGHRLPGKVVEAPKRPLQTPQREWLRGPLRGWVEREVDAGLQGPAGQLLDPASVREELRAFLAGRSDNSFFVWQWVSLGLAMEAGSP